MNILNEKDTLKIVYPSDGWILNRSGKELEGLKGKGTYFINYALYDETQPRPHGAFFTHIEPKLKNKFDEVAGKVDYAVCLNSEVREYLIKKGVQRNKCKIIRHGADDRLKITPVFGVVGRVYPSGRKGEELVDRMVEDGYDVIGWGKGWSCSISEDWNELPKFYKEIDYLVITSYQEGGPLPMIDAIAAGVPVIVREGLGWCDDFPAIRYRDDEHLFEILKQLTNPPRWSEWKEQHKQLFLSC